MTRPSTAALTRFAAICGLLVAPPAAAAQLQCRGEPADIQIRRVSFAGNQAFGDDELALHVVSTPTDLTTQYFDWRAIPAGALIGATGAAIFAREGERIKRAGIYSLVGGAVGLAASRISSKPRCLRTGTLAGDILNLGGFYRDQGFVDVRVDTTTNVDGKWVDVGFRVTEGEPVLVDSLAISGFDTATMGGLPMTLKSRRGQRYSPTITAEDIDSLEMRLRNTGYPEGRALRSVTFDSSKYRANVVFTIEPGPRARIGNIEIRRSGVQGRKASVEEPVVRGLLRFERGQIYNERALFETERRFYGVGTYLSAEVAPDLSHVAADSLVDVVVHVVEDLTHSYSLEPGFGSLDCLRVRSDYTDKAFLGDINRLEISGSISKIGLANRWNGIFDACRFLQGKPKDEDIASAAVNYNGTVRLTRPVPLRGGLLPSVSLYTERRGAYQAYLRTTLVGGALSMSKRITRNVFFEGSYNLEYGHTVAADPVLCFLFRACDESAREQLKDDKPLAVLGARFSRDRRNNLDSASVGSFARLDLRTSQTLILSDETLRFSKAVIDAGWYRRFIGPGVLALRLRAGLVGGAGQTNGIRLPPPQERLYAGGETSVRGFKQNELGPIIYITSDSALGAITAPDDAARTAALQSIGDIRVIPAGGKEMYVGNLEYRLPGPFARTIQTIAFVDVGAVTTERITQITGSKVFRITPGVAVKYFSPVGPVQFNIGYNRYDPLAGPAYSDVYRDPATQKNILTCISGVVNGVCQPLPAIGKRTNFFRKLTLTVAFPPDF